MIEATLDSMPLTEPGHFDEIYAADAEARERAARLIGQENGAVHA